MVGGVREFAATSRLCESRNRELEAFLLVWSVTRELKGSWSSCSTDGGSKYLVWVCGADCISVEEKSSAVSRVGGTEVAGLYARSVVSWELTVDGLDPQVKDDLLKQLTEDLEGFCIQK
jgi:hypothetical protein